MPKKKPKTTAAAKNITPVKDRVFGICLLLVLAIMPLVVRLAIVRVPPELTALFGMQINADFFAYYKGWVLGLAATAIFLYCLFDMLVGGYEKFDFKALIKSPPVVAAGVFLFMALVSAIFSRYRFTAWRGTADRGEGMFILLAYFIVFFAAMAHVRESKHAKLLMYGLAFSSIIMGAIGLGQFIGNDFFATSFAARLVIPTRLAERLAEQNGEIVLSPRFRIANGTLYNPNTFGKYTVMIAPILLACAVAYDGMKWVKLVFLAGGGLMLVGILGSRSLGGFIGFGASMTVLVVTLISRFVYQMLQRRKLEEPEPITGRKIAAWVAGIAVTAMLVLGAYHFVPQISDRVAIIRARFETAMRAEAAPVQRFVADGNRLTSYLDDDIRFSLVLTELHSPDDELTRRFSQQIYDGTGQPVPYRSREEGTGEAAPWPIVYTYSVPGYRRITIQQIPMGIMFEGIGLTYHNGGIYALQPNDDITDINVPSIGFAGRERWGSSRGYIWSRTLPLMPSRTIIGPGPDTYSHVFPRDVFGKRLAFRNPYQHVDKAHNIYLQTWVTTGGITALALIFLFGHYLLTTFVSLIRTGKKEGTFLHGLRFGLLAGISAYCVAAMATDSTIGSTGVFFVLLGLGYGVNIIVKRAAAQDSGPYAQPQSPKPARQ